VERKTRHTVLVPLRGGHGAQLVGDRLIETLSSLPVGLRRTLTWDQGNEMFQHERIEAETGIRIYFADPHAPWQRGTNENTNGLLRQYFPNGTDLDQFSDHHLAQVAAELNDRPRLCGDRSPRQLMQRWTAHTMDRSHQHTLIRNNLWKPRRRASVRRCVGSSNQRPTSLARKVIRLPCPPR
jgi:IS30 family transposase